MSFLRGTEEYYQKFIELQEKLRKSEEERLILEMKFNEMVQVTREEEQAYYRKLRNQYKRFLEEDRKRQERNERIMRILERIEGRASMLAAKTERFELLRQQYLAYLKRVFANTKGDQEYMRSSPMPEEIPTISEEKTDDLYSNPTVRKAMYGSKYDDIRQNSNLYEHPVIKNALSVNKEERKLSPKLDVVKQYLRSFSPPISGEEVLKASRSSEKISPFRNREFPDSNDPLYNDEFPYSYKTKAGNIANQIISSIKSKPKLTSPHREQDIKQPFLDNEDKYRTTISPVEIRVENVSENSDLSENEYSDNRKPEVFATKSKEDTKVKFEDDEKEDRIPEIPKVVEQNEVDAKIDEQIPMQKNKNMDDDEKETHEEGDFAQQENTENDLAKSDGLEDNSLLHVDTAELLNDGVGDDLTFEKKIEEKVPDNMKFVEGFESQDYVGDDEQYEEKVDNIDTIAKEDYSENEKEYDVNNLQDNNGKFGFDNEENEDGNQPNALNQEEFQMNSTPSTEDKQVIEPTIEKSKSSAEYNDANPNLLQKNEDIAQQQDNYDTGYQAKYDENAQMNNAQHGQDALQYDQNKESTLQYDENGQPIRYAEADRKNYQEEDGESVQNNPQYENLQSTLQYDQNNQPVLEYDENGQPVQYAEGDQHMISYDQMQYDQSGHYDEHGRPIMQYDENGQPIGHYNETMVQYDENGQPLHMQYDENGQPIMQYDQNGQPIMQYDENGQPLHMQYDENGQPIMQYDQNGQPMMQYDENGQPIYQYEQNEGYYAEGQIYGDEKQSFEQPISNVEDVKATKDSEGSNQQRPVDLPKQELTQNLSGKEKKGNVMEMLDTDTESVRQDTNKVSNDSDFDFSSSK